MSTILLIDDDTKLRDMVRDYLLEHELATVGVANTGEADLILSQQNIALVILDINMPGEDGFSFLTRLRKRLCNIPVLILSGRGHEFDRVKGLDLGADDYLVKPFSPRELLARAQAQLRRAGGMGNTARDIKFGQFRFDIDKVALYEAAQEVILSSGERALMKAFADHPHRTLSRHTLLGLLGDDFGASFDRSIDVRVTRLRSRIKDDAASPRYIRTVRGQGYCFTPDP
jgi:two-component system, OmpR family, phosphate regulon response regulator OmpR